MSRTVAVMLVLSWVLSAFFMYKLLCSSRRVFEKIVYTLVLLVPFVGPLIYLFLSEEVPPQSPLLRNHGPRGAYTDAMIAIQENLKELSRLENGAKKGEADSQNQNDADESGQKPS